ncbi:hypothetical protein JNUCC64_09150 [Streptomyces sp. JNUCC 64]
MTAAEAKGTMAAKGVVAVGVVAVGVVAVATSWHPTLAARPRPAY